MPSQFRFFGERPEPDAKQGNNETSESGKSLPEASRIAIAPQPELRVIEPTGAAPELTDERSDSSGLHEIVKSTDYWFNYELSLLEKNAVTSAVQWAQAGIPRQDAPIDGELPIETTLKARASEIFQEWIARVNRKVQDSVQAACAYAGDRIVRMRHALTEVERTTTEIETVEEKIFDREEALRNQQKTFGAPALLNKLRYLFLMVGIAVIDWIANIPIFNELLPQEPGSRLIWRKLVADTAQMGASGGLRRFGERFLFQPDVTIFAFGVIIFLMVLAHFGGEALRRWMVFQPEDEPLLAPSLKAQRRQCWMPMIVASVGIVLAISFLFGARSRLVIATTNGIHDAEVKVSETKKEKEDAEQTDLSKLPEIDQKLQAENAALKDWGERKRFAEDISMMNGPILLLNIVLVLTAVTAAYHAADSRLVEGRLVDPVIPELKSKLASLRMELVNNRQTLRTLDAEIQASIARAKYLASTRPLSEWEAKARRLKAVVPLFRAENARARGVDPENIVAFKQPSLLELPPVADEPFHVAGELAAWDEEFKNLRRAFGLNLPEPRVPSEVTV